MTASLQTTDQHTINPSCTIVPSQCTLDTSGTPGAPETEPQVYIQPCNQDMDIIDPSGEMTDVANTLLMLSGEKILFPAAQCNVFAHPSEDQPLLVSTESQGATILPENIINDREHRHANAYAASACSVVHVTKPIMEIVNEEKPYRDQEMTSNDPISNFQSHPADFMDVLSHWDNDIWGFEQENTLIEIMQEHRTDEQQLSTGDPFEDQTFEEFLDLAEWSETPKSPDFGPKEMPADCQTWDEVPANATSSLKETKSTSSTREHHIKSHDNSQVAILDLTEPMENLDAIVSTTNSMEDAERIVSEGLSDSCDKIARVTADQRPRVGSKNRVRFSKHLTTDTNNGEVIVIEDSSDEAADVIAVQPQRRARSRTPLITDTNNGEVIVIEDSSDSSEPSNSSDSASDITANRCTWADSTRRVRSRSLNKSEGMIRWSDEHFATGNRTIILQLWNDAQNHWKLLLALKCFAKSKEVKKFNEVLTKAKKRTEKKGGIISMQDAGKLHREFRHDLPRLQKRSLHSEERKLVNKMDNALKDLYMAVEVMTDIINEPPANHSDEDDGDYKPGPTTRNW